jgi:hypothetical protein
MACVMSVSLLELPETCRKLRALEDAIEAQRKIIANEGSGSERSVERQRLAQLLHELDRLLTQNNVTEYAALGRTGLRSKRAVEA